MMLLIFLAIGVSVAHANDLTRCGDEVEANVKRIISEPDQDKRIDLSTNLAFYLRAHPDCGRTPKIIGDITGLLDDHVDGVRMGAAMALGYIGPLAVRAVPALEDTIEKSDAIMDASPYPLLPPNSSGQAARTALREITGERVPDYQEGWKNLDENHSTGHTPQDRY
jgi:hypothetical protein